MAGLTRAGRNVLSLNVPTLNTFEGGGVAQGMADMFLFNRDIYVWSGDYPIL